MIEVKKTNQIKLTNFKCLVVGEGGTGKTTSIGTFPFIKDTLIIDADKGLKSLANLSVDFVQPTTWNQLQDIWKDIKPSDNGTIKFKEKNYKVMFIDSLSEIQYLCKEQIRREMGGGEKFTFDEWGKLLIRMESLIRAYRDLPIHTIFTAHLGKGEDITGKVLLSPDLDGSIRMKLARFFDYVFYSYILKDVEGKLHYKWTTKPGGKANAKARVPGNLNLPEHIDQDWRVVFEVLKGVN